MSANTYTTPAGITVPVLTRDEVRASRGDGATGLGTFAVTLYGQVPVWYYLSPKHGACAVMRCGAELPPLPQPNPERCGCSKREHVCGSCGRPYWIEVHGMADGWCSYCYARG